MAAPYKITPVFDETTLPAGLRREHRTKRGVWGVIRVLEGQLRLTFPGGEPERILSPERSGLVAPDQPHEVEPIGRMRMQVEFYDAPPDVEGLAAISCS